MTDEELLKHIRTLKQQHLAYDFLRQGYEILHSTSEFNTEEFKKNLKYFNDLHEASEKLLEVALVLKETRNL